MIILGIETSCDETAISIIESTNGTDITVLADKAISQIALHQQYGGVYPNMAKRAHANNLIPVQKKVLAEAAISNPKFKSPRLRRDFGGQGNSKQISNEKIQNLKEILNREPELLEQFLQFIPTIEKPPIDAIAVTEGPGLEPCLWTGINLAKALSLVWDIPVVPVNHMEGHIFSAMLRREESSKFEVRSSKKNSKSEPISYQLKAINYPALALLISGGHTELVLIKNQFDYKIIGQTRDDAAGEAFDKVARLLGLPYPGGPEISRLAEEARVGNSSFIKGGARVGEGGGFRNPSAHQNEPLPFIKGELRVVLPRPMLHSKDFNFSFSGLKTAVLYLVKKLPELTDDIKREIALEFENAVTEVLVVKTRKAMEQYGAQALLLGGGVVANTHIRKEFEKLAEESAFSLHIPEKDLTTDNALMIAVAGLLRKDMKADLSVAKGNLKIDGR